MLAKANLLSLKLVDRRVVLFGAGHSVEMAPRRGGSRDVVLTILQQEGGRVDRQRLKELVGSMPRRTQNEALRQLRTEGIIELLSDASGTIVRLTAGNQPASSARSQPGAA